MHLCTSDISLILPRVESFGEVDKYDARKCEKALVKDFSDDNDTTVKGDRIVSFCDHLQELGKCVQDSQQKYQKLKKAINDRSRGNKKESDHYAAPHSDSGTSSLKN